MQSRQKRYCDSQKGTQPLVNRLLLQVQRRRIRVILNVPALKKRHDAVNKVVDRHGY